MSVPPQGVEPLSADPLSTPSAGPRGDHVAPMQAWADGQESPLARDREAVGACQEMFNLVDQDDDGVIARDEMAQFLERVVPSHAAAYGELVFAASDADNSGYVNIAEFTRHTLHMIAHQEQGHQDMLRIVRKAYGPGGAGSPTSEMSPPLPPPASTAAEQQELEPLFEVIDADGGGTINKTELEEMLHVLRPDLSRQDCLKIMMEMDADGGGDVELDEFCLFMRKWQLPCPIPEAVERLRKHYKVKEEQMANRLSQFAAPPKQKGPAGLSPLEARKRKKRAGSCASAASASPVSDCGRSPVSQTLASSNKGPPSCVGAPDVEREPTQPKLPSFSTRPLGGGGQSQGDVSAQEQRLRELEGRLAKQGQTIDMQRAAMTNMQRALHDIGGTRSPHIGVVYPAADVRTGDRVVVVSPNALKRSRAAQSFLRECAEGMVGARGEQLSAPPRPRAGVREGAAAAGRRAAPPPPAPPDGGGDGGHIISPTVPAGKGVAKMEERGRGGYAARWYPLQPAPGPPGTGADDPCVSPRACRTGGRWRCVRCGNWNLDGACAACAAPRPRSGAGTEGWPWRGLDRWAGQHACAARAREEDILVLAGERDPAPRGGGAVQAAFARFAQQARARAKDSADAERRRDALRCVAARRRRPQLADALDDEERWRVKRLHDGAWRP